MIYTNFEHSAESGLVRHKWTNGKGGEGDEFDFVLGDSAIHRGSLFISMHGVANEWLAVPDWVRLSLNAPDACPLVILDWLMENHPEIDWLPAAVARIVQETADALPE